MDLAETVVDSILKTTYDDLPPDVIEAVKTRVIDTVGAAIAGSSSPGLEPLTGLVAGWRGSREATILVYGNKVPAHLAAMVNAAMARARDIDDVHEPGGGHLSATFVPTLFVLAEHAPRPISGKDYILAMALGTDFSARIRCAFKERLGWTADTFAPISIAAVAGKLYGFSRDQTLDAMGIGYAQSSCNSQGVIDGSLSVRLQQGFGARGGVLAADLARIGFTGPHRILQGTYGLYPLYGRNEYDPEVITRDLGKRFAIPETSLKPYPCCKHTHLPISTYFEIRKEHGLKPAQIRRIVINGNKMAYNKVGSGENKYRPRNIVDAQFSIPFTLACAVTRGKVFIDDFTDEAIKDPAILDIASKVEVRIDPEINKIPGSVVPIRFELETTDGRHLSKYAEFVKGHPKNPMTVAECAEKLRHCATFAARPLPERSLDRFSDMIANLERVDDVTKIVKLLVAKKCRREE